MTKCLICGMKKSSYSGNPCKLCGMNSWDPVLFKGFSFCCEVCKNHFKKILTDNSDISIKEIRNTGVII